MIQPSGAGGGKRGRCAHASTSFYRRPFARGDGSRGEHIAEVCLCCGQNARGPGRWVPRAAVPNADALPLLPEAGGPRQLPLFGGEVGAR